MQGTRLRFAASLNKLIFALLVALIPLVAIPYGTAQDLWITVFKCAVFSLGALWMMEGLLSGDWGINQKKLLLPLLLLVLYAFAQTLPLGSSSAGNAAGLPSFWQTISSDPYETRLFAWKLLALMLVGMMLFSHLTSERRLRILVHALIGIGVACALFGLIRQATQGEAHGFLLPSLLPREGYGQFINKNHFAYLMEMAGGLLLGQLAAGGARRGRLFIYAVMAALMWIALVLTYSRGGIFSLFGQIFVLLLLLRVRAHVTDGAGEHGRAPVSLKSGRTLGNLALKIVFVVCLVIGLALSVVWVGGDVLMTRLEALPAEAQMESADPHAGVRRTEIWHATWQMIKAHPLAGVGFAAYSVGITRHHDASGKWTPEAAHNDYLELLASGGLVGTALFIWFAVTFTRRAHYRLRRAKGFSRAAVIGALTGLAGVLIHSAVDFGLHITFNALFFVALTVIAIAHVPAGASAFSRAAKVSATFGR